MTETSWAELCVSNFEQSIAWFERVLGFRVVARDANEYAELSRGETTLQLAAEDAPYWEVERPRLLPVGQRGSGVEIVLLVEDIDAVYRQAQQARAEIVRPLANYPWHMRQFWVRHPDGYLLRPAQRILSVNTATYRQQITGAFRFDSPRITEQLRSVQQMAERLAQQGDVLGAATIYETLVTSIFEQSHLYYVAAEYDHFYQEERNYPEEEGLEGFVEECIAGLGNGLVNPQTDRAAREKSIAALLAIFQRDLHADESHGFAQSAAGQLVQYATPLERQAIVEWIRERLADEEEAISGVERQIYGQFWLDLEKETLDDEAYLRICRETGRTADLVDRLLALGRVDEAVQETRQVVDLTFLKLADLFIQHGQDTEAGRLVSMRIQEKSALPLLEWLQHYYRDRGNLAAGLEAAEASFRMQPSLKRYQELCALATHLDCWQTLRPQLLAFLEQAGTNRNTRLLIEIALEEGAIDRALLLLKDMANKDSYGYTYYDSSRYNGFGDLALQVARAAEESYPREAIELYRQQAERLIDRRGRQNYQDACILLVKIRTLYEKLGEGETWTSYVTSLREQNRDLRGLKEELANAGF